MSGIFCVDVPCPTVTLVCAEVWLLLFTVPPPTVWAVLWLERTDWDAVVPAGLGCLETEDPPCPGVVELSGTPGVRPAPPLGGT